MQDDGVAIIVTLGVAIIIAVGSAIFVCLSARGQGAEELITSACARVWPNGMECIPVLSHRTARETTGAADVGKELIMRPCLRSYSCFRASRNTVAIYK